MAASRRTMEHAATQARPAGQQRAADGQDIVDQRIDRHGEQAEIEQRAAEQNELAARDRLRDPTMRIWSSPSARVGAILALLAGTLTLASRIWPIAAFQSQGDLRLPWMVGTMAIGLAYLGGFLLADRYWKSARVVLIVAGLAHILVGFMSGAAIQDEAGATSGVHILFDLGPAALALLGAFLIAPTHGARPAPDDA
ncbi:MAG: hypothetical protein IT306_17750 [Chloroflexi bacterium]|nr:hypothetical protein [Chloroflexota bacterium]